jgi:hypothetical protein
VVGGRLRQTFAKVRGAENRPNVCLNALPAEDFGGVDCGDAKADVTDVPVGGKILISENYTHSLGFSWKS